MTPTHFWKIIASDPNGLYKADNGLLAFWMPNSVDAVAKRAAEYVVSLSELEKLLVEFDQNDSRKIKGWPASSLPEVFGFTSEIKDHVPAFWGTLQGCDRA